MFDTDEPLSGTRAPLGDIDNHEGHDDHEGHEDQLRALFSFQMRRGPSRSALIVGTGFRRLGSRPQVCS
jgi:hypothetical protein